MYAQVIKRFGCPTVFEAAEVARPVPKEGEVLIMVKATSVNRLDLKIRAGMLPALTPEFPAILHGDVAGVVEEVGQGVTKFSVGDRVFGCAGGVKGMGGALAEYMLADERLIAEIPPGVDFDEAALYPLVAMTAWDAMIERMHIKEGDRVLIHGGTGGVGHLALQLAKWKKAQVFTTVKKENMPLAQSLGADIAIDYKAMRPKEYTEIYTENEGFDYIFDTVGGTHLDQSFEAIKHNGTIVTTVSRGTYDLSLMHRKGATLSTVFMIIPLLDGIGRDHFSEKLFKISQLMDKKQLKVLKDKEAFSLDAISSAHSYMEAKEHRGKILVKI